MGTPDFAVSTLNAINNSRHDVVAVITAPDKPAGRGRKLSESSVKKYSTENGLEIIQPTSLKDEEFIKQLGSFNADLFVVVAFRMLPEIVWSMPPKGTINLHASLLPNYRGAAPINWAIINGETETGVTTFFIEKEIDTGNIIEQAKIQIGINETIGELYERLSSTGSELVLSTLDKIAEGNPQSIEQKSVIGNQKLNKAPKIFKEDCLIDFSKKAIEVHNFCRGLDPYPAAWCKLYDEQKDELKTYKLFGSELSNIPIKQSQRIIPSSNGLLFPCLDDYIIIKGIQPEGKRKMTFKEFLAGNSAEALKIEQ